MTYMGQNFRQFHVSNLFFVNFRIVCSCIRGQFRRHGRMQESAGRQVDQASVRGRRLSSGFQFRISH